jgi:hemolysin activation/secretion protein
MPMNAFINSRDLSGALAGQTLRMVICMGVAAFFLWPAEALAADASVSTPANRTSGTASANSAGGSKAGAVSEQHFFIREFRVDGGEHLLPKIEVEEAIYPYVGPYRTVGDVESARAALEKAYRDKGYETVTVQVPVQSQEQVRSGVIYLKVVPNAVGRLRINGSRFFSLDEIRREAPSLAEGTVPNFNDVSRDIVGLNQLPDRRVTPVLEAGRLPGTVDVDLNVKDTMPLHGSLELNNRYSADTTPLRVNGSVDYDNLWQLGHTVGGSFQVSPDDTNQVKVFSGFYEARIPEVDWLSLMVEGTSQDSKVNTLGGIGVAGNGDIIGLRAIMSLPAQKDFYHSVSLGFDYKHFTQGVAIAGETTDTPVTYYPLSVAYSGTWIGKGYQTAFNPSVVFDMRGLGSSEANFEVNRNGADGNFIYFRGDLSHTRDLPEGMQVFVKAQGQAADEPLVNSEQFSGGGLGTVRGYLESEELGDNALFGSVELRSPSLGGLLSKTVDDWRFYLFGEGGWMTINDPLVEQQVNYALASVGAGTRIKIMDHLNGSLDLGVPLNDGTTTKAYSEVLTFRVWADF